jgi:hypothetical protein
MLADIQADPIGIDPIQEPIAELKPTIQVDAIVDPVTGETAEPIKISTMDWDVQLGRYFGVYLLQSALSGDKVAVDLLNATGVILFDSNNVQVWPKNG